MAGTLYKKPILFTIVATVVVLIGSIATMFLPMLTPGMHPKLDTLKPFTALQLAGRDIYQREGCFYCHSQCIRPLKTEVMRYGEYSKAGEFAYDHPFLWGSKRTGPDLARVGGKYPDAWHYSHFEDPRSFFPESNMPSYAFTKGKMLNPAEVEANMKALDFPYTPEEIQALSGKTEMDALVAYMQVLGTAVPRQRPKVVKSEGEKVHIPNPLAGVPQAITDGADIYKAHCSSCHGDDGKGGIGPSLADITFLYKDEDVADDDYFELINNGTQPGMMEEGRAAKGGMPPFGMTLDKNKIWSLVSYIRSIQGK
ncbi:MAG: cbb3-type cytochrome c oxidase subunit II [Thermodesulfovibrionales bacterium]|jgi:cytochrome c oxidase cbb3-type subunit 2